MKLKVSNFELNINQEVIKAIVRRDLRMYFSNPTGYVFITLFIFLSAAAAFWTERFFQNNLANLDQLNALFPILLMFFIPALTMGVWANENKEGTDELLLTLPATDLEVVLGKYMAALGVYTASLILSLSHIFILIWLGTPDLGLMFGNYLGYWFIGGSMIAVGMLASLLTANVTIAFILGAVFCSTLVYIDSIFGLISDGLGNLLQPLGVNGHFGDFARGVISFSGVLYFLSLAGIMLYVNVLLIGRRHWPLEADGYKMWLHHLARSLALVIAVVSFNVILGRMSLRLDVTAEQLHSLSGQTEHLFDEISEDRPVFIEAFVSKVVPQQLVQTRSNLIGFLEEMDAVGGGKVQVLIHETEPFTREARDAREKFAITAREVQDPGSARMSIAQVFMGVAFKCGAEEEVIPFFDRGLPVEYELTRSIRVVARTERKKIGVLNTEAKLFGGFDFQTMQSSPAWPVVDELKKQYEVEQVSATNPITKQYDGLLVALPSSLPQEEMDNLLAYIEAGNPTLLLDDPLPLTNIGLSPSEKSGGNQNPFMRNQGPPPKEKGNIHEFVSKLGISWNSSQIAWDVYNPHPDLAQLQPEVIFVGAGNENPEAFNPNHKATDGLQEAVFLFPGYVQKGSGDYEFEPLVKTGMMSGSLSYHQLVQRSFFGVQLVNPGNRRRPNSIDYTLAAHIKGSAAPTDSSSPAKSINVIFIADLDFISQEFFEIRKAAIRNLDFDNVAFFLNCMDILVGDESFIALRTKRGQHRTLERVEQQTQEYIAQRNNDEQSAEEEASKRLAEAQARLDQRVREVQSRTDLDEQTKGIMVRNLQEVENRRFEVEKANIEADKDAKVAASKEKMEEQIRNIENGIKTFAFLIPPIPAFALGVWILIQRQKKEKEGAQAAHRLRG
jgi:ABC-2 type transport system permease protein